MDEQKRMFLAISLSFIVFFVWSYFFTEKSDVKKVEVVGETIEEAQKDAALKEPEFVTENKKDVKSAVPIDGIQTKSVYAEEGARKIFINTPLYTIEVSEKGGGFTSYLLEKYKEKLEENAKKKELIHNDRLEGIFRVGFQGGSVNGLENAVFKADTPEEEMNVLDKPEELSLMCKSTNGISVRKTYTFDPESYLIGMRVEVINESQGGIKDALEIYLDTFDAGKVGRIGFEGPSAYINDHLEKIKTKKVKEGIKKTGDIKWVSVQDRYFISAIITKEKNDAGLNISPKGNQLIETRLVVDTGSIPVNSSRSYEFDIYLGPKSLKTLKGFDNKLDKAINFGMFDFLGKPCLLMMNFIHDKFIPNYGVAIIILTIMIKILFWPLGTKSYKSMNEMKKLQPLMEEIREKYKDDKKRMNEEIMGLYKTYKINPLGGCLPMVAQIPVFFALYQMLYGTIELRHAPFLWWIKDLSAPDRLFHFDFTIPFMEAPTGIPVLTIIMGATMLLQQKLSPPPGDPTQAKMMMFMPIIFTVIFINFSSGLVLYWLVQNTLSIAQQYYISKKT